jgi:hypothetical protein
MDQFAKSGGNTSSVRDSLKLDDDKKSSKRKRKNDEDTGCC